MLYGNEGGMETCGEGVELGKDKERMEVWDSRAEGGAGGWGRSQDECPSEAIYSSPSWAILPGPDNHEHYPSISPLLIFSSYPGRGRNTFTSESCPISLFLSSDIRHFRSLCEKYDK